MGADCMNLGKERLSIKNLGGTVDIHCSLATID